MLQEHYVSLYKDITFSHISVSLAAAVLFLTTLFTLNNQRLHKRFAYFYIVTLIVASGLGILLAVLSISNQVFLGQNLSSQFLRGFKSNDLANFGFIVSVQRALIVLLISAHILYLQDQISKKTLGLIRVILGFLTVITFFYYKNVWRFELWPYFIMLMALIVGLGVLYLFLQRLPKSLQHAALAIYSFLIFMETGLLGGAGQTMPWAQTKNMALFTIYRFLPLALSLVFIYFRLKTKKSRILLTK